MLWIYSFAHFCVDFSCAYFIYSRFLNPWQWTLCLVLYNFCAFAMQAPLGLLSDKINRNAVIAAAGCLIVALSAFLAKYAVLACVTAGIGNAFFHLGGGLDTLNDCGEKCGKLGVFVSPGAFGIFFGTRLGKAKALPVYAVITGLVLISVLILLAARRQDLLKHSRNVPVSFQGILDPGVIPAALCFFLVVCLRSFAGSSMAFPWKSVSQWAVINTCAVVFGKTAGGFLADRFGAVRSSWATLVAAALLFLAAAHPAAGILAVFLFNMTMPVTLGALGRMLPGVKGFAFGLLTLALFAGLVPIISFPKLVGLPNYAYSLMALLSAVLLHIGFRKGKIQ
ncbi:MAG: hypothetical protein IKP86_13115 [Anaerolineaceae bacterium]|nr:hypothetical protein [Anaerolineaceae bacterium]